MKCTFLLDEDDDINAKIDTDYPSTILSIGGHWTLHIKTITYISPVLWCECLCEEGFLFSCVHYDQLIADEVGEVQRDGPDHVHVHVN